jgi:hypothetical protein
MNSLKELLERALKEIDRQMQAADTFTHEQALIWTLAAKDIDDTLVRLYGRRKAEEPKP